MTSLLYATFDVNGTHLILGTSQGFRVFLLLSEYSTARGSYPSGDVPSLSQQSFHMKVNRVLNGGIGIIEMEPQRSDHYFLVGGGQAPFFSRNSVLLWSEAEGAVLREIPLTVPILSLRIRHESIVVSLSNSLHVYDLQTLHGGHVAELWIRDGTTSTVPQSGIMATCLLAVASDTRDLIIATPASNQYDVHVRNITNGITKTFRCHSSPIGHVAISADGKLIATASIRGTIIRVLDANTGERIKELRRGLTPAHIHHMVFSPDAQLLACSSSSRTIHVFSMGPVGGMKNKEEEEEETKRVTSVPLHERSKILPHPASPWLQPAATFSGGFPLTTELSFPPTRSPFNDTDDASDSLVGSSSMGGMRNKVSMVNRLTSNKVPYFGSEWSFARWTAPSFLTANATHSPGGAAATAPSSLPNILQRLVHHHARSGLHPSGPSRGEYRRPDPEEALGSLRNFQLLCFAPDFRSQHSLLALDCGLALFRCLQYAMNVPVEGGIPSQKSSHASDKQPMHLRLRSQPSRQDKHLVTHGRSAHHQKEQLREGHNGKSSAYDDTSMPSTPSCTGILQTAFRSGNEKPRNELKAQGVGKEMKCCFEMYLLPSGS